MKIGIVILNYLNWTDTVECIDSLLLQENQNFEVVIVDNFSNNDSFESLVKKYSGFEQIHILQSDSNLGFAKGNNIGILYCKNVLKVTKVLVVNNDVVFTQPHYIQTIENLEYDKNIGVIGTKIIGKDGLNQNPSARFVPRFRTVFREFSFPILRNLRLNNILKLASHIKRKVKVNKEPNKVSQSMSLESFILHGSAIFLTENYLNQLDGLYPETFLYYEEEILAIVCNKLGLKLKYVDDLEIYHKEDQSSRLSFNNEEGIKYKFGRQSVKIGLKVSLMSIEQIKKKINSYPYSYIKLEQNNRIRYQFHGGNE